MTFASLLLTQREVLGLTQQQAAALLDVSRRLYCYWESGERIPLAVTKEGVMRRLAKVR